MTTPLTIVARIVARPGCEAELGAELRKLIPPTLGEDGCIQYDLHRSLEEPRVFLFFENWRSRPHWEAHMKSPHLAAFGKVAERLVESLQIDVMTRVQDDQSATAG